MEEYFKVEFNNCNFINKVILNPAKWNHREYFVKPIEEQLETYQLKEDLTQIKLYTIFLNRTNGWNYHKNIQYSTKKGWRYEKKCPILRRKSEVKSECTI